MFNDDQMSMALGRDKNVAREEMVPPQLLRSLPWSLLRPSNTLMKIYWAKTTWYHHRWHLAIGECGSILDVNDMIFFDMLFYQDLLINLQHSMRGR